MYVFPYKSMYNIKVPGQEVGQSAVARRAKKRAQKLAQRLAQKKALMQAKKLARKKAAKKAAQPAETLNVQPIVQPTQAFPPPQAVRRSARNKK